MISGGPATGVDDRPPFNRTAWVCWLSLAASAALLAFGFGLDDQRQRQRDQRSFVPVTAAVVERNDDRTLQISYQHPRVGSVVSRLWAFSGDLETYAVGETIEILADPADPYRPQAVGDDMVLVGPLIWTGAFVAVPAAAVAVALWSRRRSRQLAASDVPTLRMLAARIPSRRERRARRQLVGWELDALDDDGDRDDGDRDDGDRDDGDRDDGDRDDGDRDDGDRGDRDDRDDPDHRNKREGDEAVLWRNEPWSGRVALYPLDAPAGGRPACVVRVAPTDALPLGDGYVPVDVKGVPRPGGRVVLRVGRRTVWPRGRTLLTAAHPRPRHTARDHPTWLGGAAPELSSASTALGRLETTWIVAVATLLLVVGGTITFFFCRAAQRASERSQLQRLSVIAEVVRHGDFDVDLRVRLPGRDEDAEIPTPVPYPEDFAVGNRYPAFVERDASAARLEAAPYDWRSAAMWWWIPALPGLMATIGLLATRPRRLAPASTPVDPSSMLTEVAAGIWPPWVAVSRAGSPAAEQAVSRAGSPAAERVASATESAAVAAAGAAACRWLRRRIRLAGAFGAVALALMFGGAVWLDVAAAWKDDLRRSGGAVVGTVVGIDDDSGKGENDKVELHIASTPPVALTIDGIGDLRHYPIGSSVEVWFDPENLDHAATAFDANTDAAEDVATATMVGGVSGVFCAGLVIAAAGRGLAVARRSPFRPVKIVRVGHKRKAKGSRRTILRFADSNDPWSLYFYEPPVNTRRVVIAGTRRYRLVAADRPYVVRRPWLAITRRNWLRHLDR